MNTKKQVLQDPDAITHQTQLIADLETIFAWLETIDSRLTSIEARLDVLEGA